MKKSIFGLLKKEVQHEGKFVLELSLTFIGATLVGRTVWQWIIDYSNTVVAFISGIAILFIVAGFRHHFLTKRL